MPRIKYIDWNPAVKSQAIIAKANEILETYAGQGFDLTLRQLFYQFVSRDLISNTERSYENLGYMINQGRLAGLIDWAHIVDRTRSLESLASWDDPAEAVASIADQYRIDRWENQENYVEVWIEKDALTGVIEPICNTLDVSYFSCRGYPSQSEIWKAGRRLAYMAQTLKKKITVIHLGDHDPSGIDMTRDIDERLYLFAGITIEIDRIALNMDQIEEYDPPPNPTKATDSRSPKYVEEYGEECWELDALEPKVIQELVEETILGLRDEDKWDEAEERENQDRDQLAEIADNLKNE